MSGHIPQHEFGALERLAREYGVQAVFRDGFKEFRRASPETLLAVLQALDAPIDRADDAPDGLRRARRERWERFAPPTVVVWGGQGGSLDLRLPAAEVDGSVECRLTLEDGRERRWEEELDSLTRKGGCELDGRRFVALRLPLPSGLPNGYHRLTLDGAGRTSEVRLLAAPVRCHELEPGERPWGVFLPLHALHTERSPDLGDLGDLEALFAWVNELGGRLVGTLPLLASYLDKPFEPSPYVPVSRVFWNELYADIRRTPEWEASAAAREKWAPADPGELVDHRASMAMRREVIKELVAALSDERRAALEAFADERAELRSYAAFRATVETRGETWGDWPERLRGGALEAGDYDERRKLYHLYVQWLADAQMRELDARVANPGLYLDLPLGVHAGGFDVWRRPEAFAFGVSGGAPPDRFFTKGQNWGFAPTDPRALRGEGLDYWRECLRFHLRYAGVLRLDHFMSLHRLYWVPEGAEASQGTYVQYPCEEMYAAVCIESVREKAWIIGEDLGTVPTYVRRRMDEHAIDGMYVAQFDMRSEEPVIEGPKPSNLASVNTHDTPTFAAWWQAKDADDQLELGLLDEHGAEAVRGARATTRRAVARKLGLDEERAAVLRALLEELGRGPARAVLVTLEDLWGETEQQNTPGTTDQRPNWRRRAKLSLEEMRESTDVVETLRAVDEARS